MSIASDYKIKIIELINERIDERSLVYTSNTHKQKVKPSGKKTFTSYGNHILWYGYPTKSKIETFSGCAAYILFYAFINMSHV